MKSWKPYELHTHTFHSDGQHSLLEMATEAKKLGLEGLALTDHNTMSGLIHKEEIEATLDIHIMHGLEWTTFYGHMVMLGVSNYVDWRDFTPIDIHRGISEVHNQGGIVGIVHPYRIGSPICTGCFWEYEVEDWNDIDYIEVWSGTFPSVKKDNKRAFELWTRKLNEGYKISAINGRDWHNTSESDEPIAATFIKSDFVQNVKSDKVIVQGIKQGEVSVSMGPLLEMMLEVNQEEYFIGEVVPVEKGKSISGLININLDYTVRNRKWSFPGQKLNMKINSNKGILAELSFASDKSELNKTVDLNGVNWIRAELFGVFNEVDTMIAFTNPIYLQNSVL